MRRAALLRALLVSAGLASAPALAQGYATTCIAAYDACLDYPSGVFVPDPRQSDETWRGLVTRSRPADPNFRVDFAGMTYDGATRSPALDGAAFERLFRTQAAHYDGYADVTYRHLDRQRRWFVVSGIERVAGYGDVVFYARYMRMPRGFVVVDVRYPRSSKAMMDPHVEQISWSLRALGG